MRTIPAKDVIEAVRQMCIEANCHLGDDIIAAVRNAHSREDSELGRKVLARILENASTASGEGMAICQDTGMAVVFVKLGQDVHVSGSLEDAINEGVRQGYRGGYLRNSVVRDPLDRVNTGDNTPAVIHWEVVSGDKLTIAVAPKGFGSENMSRLAMLRPADGREGVKEFVIDAVTKAGGNPCPPVILGVGVGGTMEKAALLAKKALLRPLGTRHPRRSWADLEQELLDKINEIGIGPMGFGGRTTALGVNIETFPTHIAGLPVAVNVSCHATRHREVVL